MLSRCGYSVGRSVHVYSCLVSVIIQLWIEVNTARRTERRETEKETEERVRINKGEENKIKKNLRGLQK